MLRFILFDTTLFNSKDDVEEARTDIMWLLEALCQRNMHYLKMHPNTPRLYRSGVKWAAPAQYNDPYEYTILKEALGRTAKQRDIAKVLELVKEVFGSEHFCDIGRILELGEIDCDGLACWRVAELRQSNVQARPFMTSRTRIDGGTTYHALVLWPPFGNVNYATSEDPSLLLGMSQPQRASDRAEEIRKNVERCDILKKYGLGPAANATDMERLATVLGLARNRLPAAPPAGVSELERILRRRAA